MTEVIPQLDDAGPSPTPDALPGHDRLRALARDHLVLHFSDNAADARRGVPVIVRGEGCHVFDDVGKRYIDGLSGLYCATLGHSHGDEIGEAAHEQMRRLPFTSNW